jgi:fatty acid amide hydrolase
MNTGHKANHTGAEQSHPGAVALAQAIRVGEITVREAVEACIERIEAFDPVVNAVVLRRFDQARQEADRADANLAAGKPVGPLHGVPITIKDTFNVAGLATTVGLASRKSRVERSDGPLVGRLREAGAIVLGKTNVIQLLVGWESDNPVFGRTNNPWDLARTPGGSSGGEAAALAYGASRLGLGGDFGGSVRVPAAFCGVCGLKPSAHRLTQLDIPPNRSANRRRSSLSPDRLPQTSKISPSRWRFWRHNDRMPSTSRCRRCRGSLLPTAQHGFGSVGLTTTACSLRLRPSGERSVKPPTRSLSTVRTWSRSNLPTPSAQPGCSCSSRAPIGTAQNAQQHVARSSFRLRKIFMTVSMPKAPKHTLSIGMKSTGRVRLSRVLAVAYPSTPEEYFRRLDERRQLLAETMAAWDETEIDAVMCPVYRLPAPLHGTTSDLLEATSYAFVANLFGLPAGTVPVSRVQTDEESDRPDSHDPADRLAKRVEQGSAGLPVAVQVIGRPWREDLVLAAMATIERGARDTGSAPAAPVRPPPEATGGPHP